MSRFTTYKDATASDGQTEYQYQYANGVQRSGKASQIPVASSSQSHSQPQPTSQRSSSHPQTPSDDPNPVPKPKAKRRKVNHACLYCRRSHMTCDDGRPCQRCIKREIGHLCHDEPRSQGHAQQGNASDQGQKQSQGQEPVQRQAAPGGWVTEPPTSTTSINDGLGSRMSLLSSDAAAYPQQQSAALSFQQQSWIPPYRPGTFGTEFAVLTEILENIDRGVAFDGIITPSETLTQTQTRQGSFYSTSAYSELSQSQPSFVQPPSRHHPRPQGPGHTGQSQTLHNLSQIPMGSSIAAFSSHEHHSPTNLNPNPNARKVVKESSSSIDTGAPMTATAESPNPASMLTPGSTVHSIASPESERNGNGIANNPQRQHSRSGSLSSGAQYAASPASSASIPTHSSLPAPTPSGAPQPTPSSTPSITTIPTSIPNVSTSSINRFLLTAADQEPGSREDRLARVIRSKYEAGLLKPYNYVKGYARLSRWMEGNVSQESKARVLMPLSVLRPKFRAVAQSLRPLDLVFIEEAFERLLLDYDRVFASMAVPACLWRRTGEIYKGNREFSELVGLDGYLLREGKLCIYELMAEESAVNYWEKYGTVAFDSSQKAVLTSCVLRYKPKLDSFASFNARPSSRGGGTKDRYTTPNTYGAYSTYPAPMMPPTTVLARTGMTNKLWGSADSSHTHSTLYDSGKSALPADEAAGGPQAMREERGLVPVPAEEGLISCCFSFTIRRDKWGIPSMIVGNFVRC